MALSTPTKLTIAAFTAILTLALTTFAGGDRNTQLAYRASGRVNGTLESAIAYRASGRFDDRVAAHRGTGRVAIAANLSNDRGSERGIQV